MRRRPVRLVAAGLLSLLVILTGASLRFGDATLFPTADPGPVTVYLVSNGFHSGLILPRPTANAVAIRRAAPAALAVTTRFAHYDWVEMGWGDDRFYRAVPTLDRFDWNLGLQAVLGLGDGSVMHVVGVEGDPREPFAGADLVRLQLSPEGFGRLLDGIDRTFGRDAAGEPEDLGPGLYGPSLFYRAVGTFSLFNVCNHWTARMLGLAGVPVWPAAATLPRGLVLDLMLRSGLSPEPPALPVSAGTQ